MSNDIDWNDSDYNRPTATVETPHGIFRAVIEHDQYPEAPYNDFGCPVYRVATRGFYGGPVGVEDEPEYGFQSDKDSGVDFPSAMSRLTDSFGSNAAAVADRWLRIYHGGGVAHLSSTVYQGGDEFLTYDTRAMREAWGQEGEQLETSDPEAEEWQAYLDSDVWIVSVEKAVTFDEDDEPADWATVEGPVHGFYGDKYAKEEAVSMRDYEVRHVASQMLPVGVSA